MCCIMTWLQLVINSALIDCLIVWICRYLKPIKTTRHSLPSKLGSYYEKLPCSLKFFSFLTDFLLTNAHFPVELCQWSLKNRFCTVTKFRNLLKPLLINWAIFRTIIASKLAKNSQIHSNLLTLLTRSNHQVPKALSKSSSWVKLGSMELTGTRQTTPRGYARKGLKNTKKKNFFCVQFLAGFLHQGGAAIVALWCEWSVEPLFQRRNMGRRS